MAINRTSPSPAPALSTNNSSGSVPGDTSDPILTMLFEQLNKVSGTLTPYQNALQGGVAMVSEYLQTMLASMPVLDSNSSYVDVENKLQMALIDISMNAEAYGLSSDTSFMEALSDFIEITGSGQHSVCFETANANIYSEALAKVISKINDKINSGDIPADSIVSKIMREVNNRTGDANDILTGLQWGNYSNNSGQGWITQNLQTLSPLTRLGVIITLLEHQSISSDDIRVILTGSKSDVDALSMKYSGKNALDLFLSRQDGWEYRNTPQERSGADRPVDRFFNYSGASSAGRVTPDYLKSLFRNFPKRNLTSDEVAELNRTSDTTKIIYELIKYRISKNNEASLATASNI